MEVTEPVRERTFHFPILFLPQVCANFAVTLQSYRSNNTVSWAQLQTLLAGSFLRHVPLKPSDLLQIWHDARCKTPKSITTLFFVALSCPDCFPITRYASLADWLFFLAYCLKHPISAWKVSQAIAAYPELWQFLDEQTAARSQEKAAMEAEEQEEQREAAKVR
jgi:hypothetical protein